MQEVVEREVVSGPQEAKARVAIFVSWRSFLTGRGLGNDINSAYGQICRRVHRVSKTPVAKEGAPHNAVSCLFGSTIFPLGEGSVPVFSPSPAV